MTTWHLNVAYRGNSALVDLDGHEQSLILLGDMVQVVEDVEQLVAPDEPILMDTTGPGLAVAQSLARRGRKILTYRPREFLF